MKVVIYGADWCRYCKKAKALCESRGFEYNWIDIDKDPDAKTHVKETLGASTIPQIYVDGEHVGGFDEFSQAVE